MKRPGIMVIQNEGLGNFFRWFRAPPEVSVEMR
jgi:hypothetical protein